MAVNGWTFFAVGMLISCVVLIALSLLSLKRSRVRESRREAWEEERKKLERRLEQLETPTFERENKDLQ